VFDEVLALTIAGALLREYPAMNTAQRAIVAHADGPLLVIAGPGSGKTYSLVLRAINLLLREKAQPNELLLCTFTEKAAFELRDRIAAAAQRVGYTGDLSTLRVGTIHSICNKILLEHRHHTPVGIGYQTLDELTELLFLFEQFDAITGPGAAPPYFGRWQSKWATIESIRNYFNKITEELVKPEALIRSSTPFLRELGRAYGAYRAALFANNRVDFAHQQKLVFDLLQDPAIRTTITNRIRYVLVDEYQDTNYVQEQVLGMLASAAGNLCVVGDEDQSLYRFRGATVRNILEFPDRFPGCKTIKLTTNYRSHAKIVQAYDRWMASANWANPQGTPFRFDKSIEPDPETTHHEYPAVFAIWGQNKQDEARRFADFVAYLKAHDVIEDYNQVALLLHSVRVNRSGPYLGALEAKGIPVYCPRARAYFDNEEVRLMVGCFALVFGYHGDGRGELHGPALQGLSDYVDDCLVELARRCQPPHPLASALQTLVGQIARLRDRQALDMRPADFFYRLLAHEPFVTLLQNENRARNLAIFSQLLNAFQNYWVTCHAGSP
jgi:DNA helicase II / ATP-dependent DNA helicase PcrA